MNDKPNPENGSELMQEAAKARRSLVGEFLDFLGENKKWWLAPILIAILVLGALVVLGGTGAAPFIYTLF